MRTWNEINQLIDTQNQRMVAFGQQLQKEQEEFDARMAETRRLGDLFEAELKKMGCTL